MKRAYNFILRTKTEAATMSQSKQDRRKHERFKIRAPIEFYAEGSKALRTANADLSLGGCYLEMLFTFRIGTTLDVTLQLGRAIQAKAIVVSRDLQVGNGIQFIDMSRDDQDVVRDYVQGAIKG